MTIQTQKRYSKLSIARTAVFALVISAFPVLSVTRADASPIMGRSVTISNSVGDASGVSYALSTTSALPTTSVVKSVEIKFCTALTGGCVAPAGFSALLSTLASQPTGLGAASGWTVNAATQGSLRIVNASNSTASSGLVSIDWNNAHNPTATNTTFYGIITTYSDSGWSTAIDSGSVALSTATQIQVSLKVDESLSFCAGTSITGQDCSTIAGNLVNLGSGSITNTVTGTSVLAASTNANSGYSISITGNTLTSGLNTIPALASGSSSVKGSKQFGLNLASANTIPAVGAAKSGAGTAIVDPNYATNDNFRFVSGDTVASSVGPTNVNAFTVGYIANIDGITPAGAYTSNLTYTATSNF